MRFNIMSQVTALQAWSPSMQSSNRMRILSSTPVVRSAEHIARTIMDTYLEPDKSFGELRDMVKRGSIDLLREFSEACREEFDEMRDQQL